MKECNETQFSKAFEVTELEMKNFWNLFIWNFFRSKVLLKSFKNNKTFASSANFTITSIQKVLIYILYRFSKHQSINYLFLTNSKFFISKSFKWKLLITRLYQSWHFFWKPEEIKKFNFTWKITENVRDQF